MKKTDMNDFWDFDEELFDDMELTESDIALLEQIDIEIESTLKNIRIFDLQTNKQMSDLLSRQISDQGDRINMLMDKASPVLKKYLVDRMNKIKDTYLN